jgi:hypothetical protein
MYIRGTVKPEITPSKRPDSQITSSEGKKNTSNNPSDHIPKQVGDLSNKYRDDTKFFVKSSIEPFKITNK